MHLCHLLDRTLASSYFFRGVFFNKIGKITSLHWKPEFRNGQSHILLARHLSCTLIFMALRVYSLTKACRSHYTLDPSLGPLLCSISTRWAVGNSDQVQTKESLSRYTNNRTMHNGCERAQLDSLTQNVVALQWSTRQTTEQQTLSLRPPGSSG